MLESVTSTPVDTRGPNVVALDSAPDPRVRATRASKDFYEAWNAHEEEARAAGLPVHGGSSLGLMFHAGCRLAQVWQDRAQRLERTLRAVLASDFVTDPQRADIIAVFFGRRSVGRDPKVLTETESRLVADYRACGANGKTMIRTMAKLAAEAETGGQ